MAKPGNKNAAKGRRIRDGIRHALANYEADDCPRGQADKKIGMELVKCAVDPTSPHYEFAVNQIGNRIDGAEKAGGESATEVLRGISAAFNALEGFARAREAIGGTTLVPDGSVFSDPVCVEEGGRGEPLGIREDSGGSEEP